MSEYIKKNLRLPEFDLWEKKKSNNSLFSFTLELTARCNNNCRHCYINLPSNDKDAMQKELGFDEIKKIADEAVELGALWCLITGGEPLLREDFEEIYIYLKRKGLFVSVFTNGVLINENHIKLFKKYPPRDLEITVYGITKNIYGKVTQKPQNFEPFMENIKLLIENNIKVSLKNVVIKSNLSEFDEISKFCRKYSVSPYRFDPLIHLRLDRSEKRNDEIKKERLLPEEIAELEKSDYKRFSSMQRNCEILILNKELKENNYLFSCGAGLSEFVVSYNGYFRLCSSLCHPDCIYDLKKGSIKDARQNFVPKIRAIKSFNKEFLSNCSKCKIINLCLWCPAHAYLETGHLDSYVEYFCEVAKARENIIKC
ncbi:MAG: radical SAM protein [Desulforegulaceae bacterium]|nr:radical SAM protein [Desulforegulaceae bacterium]